MTVYYLTGFDYKLFEVLAKYRNVLVEQYDAKTFLERFQPIRVISKIEDMFSQGDAIAIEISNKVFVFWLGAYR